jgi:hypothetical protein
VWVWNLNLKQCIERPILTPISPIPFPSLIPLPPIPFPIPGK